MVNVFQMCAITVISKQIYNTCVRIHKFDEIVGHMNWMDESQGHDILFRKLSAGFIRSDQPEHHRNQRDPSSCFVYIQIFCVFIFFLFSCSSQAIKTMRMHVQPCWRFMFDFSVIYMHQDHYSVVCAFCSLFFMSTSFFLLVAESNVLHKPYRITRY